MKQHSPRFLAIVEQSRKEVKEVTADELREEMNKREVLTLIDVREDNEWITGHIPTAIHHSKGTIERDIEKTISDVNTNLVLYCSGGFRSILAAKSLQDMGYKRVRSLTGGLQSWVDIGYPLAQ